MLENTDERTIKTIDVFYCPDMAGLASADSIAGIVQGVVDSVHSGVCECPQIKLVLREPGLEKRTPQCPMCGRTMIKKNRPTVLKGE